jgi:hypothetical protein
MLAIAIAAVAAGATVAALRVDHDGTDGHGRRSSALDRRHAASHDGPRVLAVAAAYLGVPRPRLRSELRSGRTLAEIADATSHRSAAALLDALIIAREHQISAGARAKGAYPATPHVRLVRLRARLTAEVYGSARPSPGLSAGRRAPS